MVKSDDDVTLKDHKPSIKFKKRLGYPMMTVEEK